MSDEPLFTFDHLPKPERQASIYGLVEVEEEPHDDESREQDGNTATPESPTV